MTSSELRDAFRLETYDLAGSNPQLWSDGEIFGYEDDAQKLFCRLVEGIGDGSSALTQINIAPTTVSVGSPPVVTTTVAPDIVTISPLILKFRDAWRTADGRPVDLVNYEDMAANGIRFNRCTAARPDALVIGMEPNKARIWPAPTTDSVGQIQLLVDRLPLKSISDEDQKFEIAEQHHVNLLPWMKHRAYAKQDADTYDAKKSNDFAAEFRAYCSFAKAEKERAKSKVRVVRTAGAGAGTWGGGVRAGWSSYGGRRGCY